MSIVWVLELYHKKNKVYILKLDKYNVRLFIHIIRLSTYFLYQFPKNIQRMTRALLILFLESHFRN
jgi:hypothetical protein